MGEVTVRHLIYLEKRQLLGIQLWCVAMGMNIAVILMVVISQLTGECI